MSRIHQAIQKAQSEHSSIKKEVHQPRQNLAEIRSELIKEFSPVRRSVEGSNDDTGQHLVQSDLGFPGFVELAFGSNPEIVTGPGVGSLAIKPFRHLSTQLDQLQANSELRTVFLTGSRGGEGATLTAANLSLTLAQVPSRNVLLVDANLANPRIHSLLGFPQPTRGLGDFLNDGASAGDVVYRTSISNFFVTPSGGGPVGEDSMAQKVRSFLGEISARFDWVIVDCPSVASPFFEDMEAFGGVAAGILLVVRASGTPSKEVSNSIAKLRGANFVGFVLNGVENLRRSNVFYSSRLNPA
jgi:protein-tyrosine kinase